MLSKMSFRMRIENEKPLFAKWSQIYLLLEKPVRAIYPMNKPEVIHINDDDPPYRRRKRQNGHFSRSSASQSR